MARTPRYQPAGGIFHVTSRGNRHQRIFFGDADRRRFLEILETVVRRFRWECLAYCLMTNHYHLLVRTPAETLSSGMERLNGPYARWLNRKYDLTGHVFQGRFHSALIREETHLVEAARYIVLNPVRAGLCDDPAGWRWSSYRATIGAAADPSLGTTGPFAALGAVDESSRAAFAALVEEGLRRPRAAEMS